MTDPAAWEKGNEEYLAAALAWLRLRLRWHVARGKRSDTLPPMEIEESRELDVFRWRLLRWTGREALVRSATKMLPPAPPDLITEEQLAAAAARMAAAAKMDPPPALLIVAQRMGLSDFERNVFLLCAGMELDTSIAGYCARANDDPTRAHPTFALALSLFDEPVWDALSPERPLRYWRLIEINQPGASPLTVSALRADERIVSYIKGLNYLDDRLAHLVTPLPHLDDQDALPDSQQSVVRQVLEELKDSPAGKSIRRINLVGADAVSKELVSTQAADSLGLHLYRLRARLLPSDSAPLETLARLWMRDSILLPIALLLDAHEDEVANQTDEHTATTVNRFLDRTGGVIFLSSRTSWPGSTENMFAIDVDKPTAKEQRAAWAAALGQQENRADALLLTSQFNLNLSTIKQITSALGEGGDPKLNSDRLWNACLAHVRPQLENLAQRLIPKAGLSDIVLPEPENRLLHQIVAQMSQRSKVYDDWGFANKMNRGLGISALFAGDSGTGKTMAAECIANELRLDLYRVDLSAVVSKYIGETEKNLRRVFDAAEDGGAILFFDEADALFGKRSEVKDSHDRYANIEINYLLQRIEAYRGLAILATNMKDALDQAFVRRLRFIVDFPYPGEAERRAIWGRIFPPETALGVLDLDRLARLDLTGGDINNIALNAAFLAAHSNTKVTMSCVLDAAKSEFRKLGRFVSEASFRWTEPDEPEAEPVSPAGFGDLKGTEGLGDTSLGAIA